MVYRVLPRLFEARDEELARGAAPSPMSIDEAHYYLPQVGAREDFNKKAAEAVNHWGGWAQSPPPTTPPWQSSCALQGIDYGL